MQTEIGTWFIKVRWNFCNVVAGWSSLVARRAHNPKVVGSNPAPATKFLECVEMLFIKQLIAPRAQLFINRRRLLV